VAKKYYHWSTKYINIHKWANSALNRLPKPVLTLRSRKQNYKSKRVGGLKPNIGCGKMQHARIED